MLLLLSALAPIAHAACDSDAPSVVDMLPADGTVGVPQSASVGAFVAGDQTAFEVSLVDSAGVEVPTRRSLRSWQGPDLAVGTEHLVLLTPDEELSEGETYTVIATPDDKDGADARFSSFVVGPSADIVPTPPRLTLQTVGVEEGLDDCGHPRARRFQAELTGLDDTWAGSGFISLYATYSGGGLDTLVGIVPAPADGEFISVDAVLPISGQGGGDCLSAVVEGESRKPSAPVLVCPDSAEPPMVGAFEGGSGCNTAAAPAGLVGMVGGIAAMFLRRREQD
ncbi:MAG: Ig-like domain-containing protein [Myxococcota bacterium]|nr:Ig-like domain-containing protein [Myxococcota bacterium]